MSRRNRVEYLICTLGVFMTGFLMYGFLGSQQPYMNFEKSETFLFFGLLGGFGFSGLVSTLILSARFFSKCGTVCKVICAMLWPITFGACVFAGYLCYIPYQIYNLVKMFTPSLDGKEGTL